MFMGNALLRKLGIEEVFRADRNKLVASNEKQTDNHTSMHWEFPVSLKYS